MIVAPAAPRPQDPAHTCDIRQSSYNAFLRCLAAPATEHRWWSAVIITAGSKSQAELYREQIRYRSDRGYLPRNVSWLVVPIPKGIT